MKEFMKPQQPRLSAVEKHSALCGSVAASIGERRSANGGCSDRPGKFALGEHSKCKSMKFASRCSVAVENGEFELDSPLTRAGGRHVEIIVCGF